MRRLTGWYGASPVHLAALLLGGAVSAYAVTRLSPDDAPLSLALWFGGTLLAHDLVLFPVYAALDNVAGWLGRRVPSRREVPWVNHVRVPVFLSGLLLLAWFPLILRLSPGYERATGHGDSGYLGRWLLVSAVLTLGSALLYLVRSGRAARRRPGVVSPSATGRPPAGGAEAPSSPRSRPTP